MSAASALLDVADGPRSAVIRVGVVLTVLLLAAEMGSLLSAQVQAASSEARISVARGERAAVATLIRDLEGGETAAAAVPLAQAEVHRLIVQSRTDPQMAVLPCASVTTSDGARRTLYRFDGNSLERRIDCRVGGRWRMEVAPTALLSELGSGRGRFRFFDAQGGEIAVPAQGLSLRQRARVGRVRVEWVDGEGTARLIADVALRTALGVRARLDAIAALSEHP